MGSLFYGMEHAAWSAGRMWELARWTGSMGDVSSYLHSPALYGAVIPAIVSFYLFRRGMRRWLFGYSDYEFYRLILFVLSAGCAYYSAYWTNGQLHFINLSVAYWPLYALIDARFSVTLAYPLTFLAGLITEVVRSGLQYHWSPTFWSGIGGAGWHSALFLYPLLSVALAYLLRVTLAKKFRELKRRKAIG